MKRLLISEFVVIGRCSLSQPHFVLIHLRGGLSAFTTGSASAKKSMVVAGSSKLPVEEFEDMSLVFSTPTKH